MTNADDGKPGAPGANRLSRSPSDGPDCRKAACPHDQSFGRCDDGRGRAVGRDQGPTGVVRRGDERDSRPHRRLNPKVNAIVSLQDRGDLLRQAGERDGELARGEYRGWMHGFPQAIKDLAATKGIRTTQGSRIFKDFVPPPTRSWSNAYGAPARIIIGKTNTPEFGLGSNTYNDVFGRTLNAYDQSKTAGGSSGGAGVSVALHMLPVADGSDHGGSLRNPAAFNNVFGFRTSFGRVPTQALDGSTPPWACSARWRARCPTLRCCCRCRRAMTRAYRCRTGRTRRSSQPLKRDFKGTRIAWLGDFRGHLPFEPGILELCRTALKTFEALGCTVEEAWPDFPIERVWRTGACCAPGRPARR